VGLQGREVAGEDVEARPAVQLANGIGCRDVCPCQPGEIGSTLAYMAGEPGVEVELFGSLFVFMQQLTRQVEERLQRFGLTSRQWLLLGVLEKAFPGYAPTISEATAVFGTSRQNVKQVAGQLERGGWLRIERDAVDRRALRLVLTERLAEFHEPRVRADQTEFIHAVFTGLAPRERALFLDLVTRCTANLSLLAGPASPPERGFMNRHTSATDMSATDVGTERSPHSRSGSLTAQTVPAAGAPPATSRRTTTRS